MKLQLICLHPDTSLEYWLKLDGRVLCRPPRGKQFFLEYGIGVRALGWKCARAIARQHLKLDGWPTSADVHTPG